MTPATYPYRTLDGSHVGYALDRRRARQDAAQIARQTGQPVELIEADQIVTFIKAGPNRARRTVEKRNAA